MTTSPVTDANEPTGPAARTPAAEPVGAETATRRRAPWPLGLVVGGGIVAIVVLVAILAPLIAPADPNAQDLTGILLPPGPGHLLGTDSLGRDIASRIIHGARFELGLVLPPLLVTVLVALPLGMAAGYVGRWVDKVVSAISDTLLTFPSLVAAIVLVALLGNGTVPLMVTLVVTQLPAMVRYVRGFAKQVSSSQYVLAARSSGSSTPTILRVHVLGNILGQVLVIASLFASEAILVIAALGFLGVGVQPPNAEWGTMLSEGRIDFMNAPHVMIAPGAAIALLILGFNLLGDGLRDRLDTRG